MQLTANQLRKADEPLIEALTHANGDEQICAILDLDSPPLPPPPPVRDYPSRTEWRTAIAVRNKAIMHAAVGGTVEELRRLGLEPRCWEMGQAVVNAPAALVAAALELAGVTFAILDFLVITWEPFPMPETRQPGSIEPTSLTRETSADSAGPSQSSSVPTPTSGQLGTLAPTGEGDR